MAYRERWEAAIGAMRRVLGGFPMKEECKWGKGRNETGTWHRRHDEYEKR